MKKLYLIGLCLISSFAYAEVDIKDLPKINLEDVLEEREIVFPHQTVGYEFGIETLRKEAKEAADVLEQSHCSTSFSGSGYDFECVRNVEEIKKTN